MSGKKHIKIVHLYAKEMNIYGDNGNVLALLWRLEQRGFQPQLSAIGVEESMPKDTDIIVAGGGQDSGQLRVQADLKHKAKTLQAMRDDGVVMLGVCGMYQLLGRFFRTIQGDTIDGASVLDVTTIGGPQRLIGNITIETEFGRMVGFENHSGETTLGSGMMPLGRVEKGSGNSSRGQHEGARVHNVFATYLHGPLLPKNPFFADELLRRAIDRRYGRSVQLEQLDDTLASHAAQVHANRPQ